MYFQKLGNRYSFLYYDTTLKKNIRLKRTDTPHIQSDSEAEAFCQTWNAKYDAMKSRLQEKLRWQKKYHRFEELARLYIRDQKEEFAPNSWKMNEAYLQYYVFPFFLEVKQENNLHLWHRHFETFREYLETVKPIRTKAKTLAYSSMNSVIRCLNTFMSCFYRRRLLDQLHKCRYFSESKTNRKTETSVMSEVVQRILFERLKGTYPHTCDFFWVSVKTGMRLNEILGLSLADFFAGLPTTESLRLALQPYPLKALGYICLDSQPSHGSVRTKEGVVPRKPLKGKKRMDLEDARTIPIFEKETFNMLVLRWNKQQILFERGIYGKNPKNYLLFDGLTRNIYSRMLRLSQKGLKLDRVFTAHDARHTYCTWLAEMTGGNYQLCRMILGHSKLEVTLRYVHMNARIQQQMKVNRQLLRSIPLVG